MLRAVSELEIGGKHGETKMNVGWVDSPRTESQGVREARRRKSEEPHQLASVSAC